MLPVVVVRPFDTGVDTVHSAACRDLERDLQTSDVNIRYASLDACEQSYLDDEEMNEMGWTWETVRVMPCAKK